MGGTENQEGVLEWAYAQLSKCSEDHLGFFFWSSKLWAGSAVLYLPVSQQPVRRCVSQTPDRTETTGTTVAQAGAIPLRKTRLQPDDVDLTGPTWLRIKFWKTGHEMKWKSGKPVHPIRITAASVETLRGHLHNLAHQQVGGSPFCCGGAAGGRTSSPGFHNSSAGQEGRRSSVRSMFRF